MSLIVKTFSRRSFVSRRPRDQAVVASLHCMVMCPTGGSHRNLHRTARIHRDSCGARPVVFRFGSIGCSRGLEHTRRLAWISTEMDSANIMSLGSTIFRAFRSEATVTCYASWCADSLVARRHFALSRFDFRSFRVSGGKMTPGRDGYQNTNMPNTNERIPCLKIPFSLKCWGILLPWKSRLGWANAPCQGSLRVPEDAYPCENSKIRRLRSE